MDSSPAISGDGLTVFVGSDDGKLYAVDTGTTPPPPEACTGRDLEACSPSDTRTWCCNLVAHDCVCAQFATADQIRRICSAQKNGGIECWKCKAAPQCRAAGALGVTVE